jgi:hypothetical protein
MYANACAHQWLRSITYPSAFKFHSPQPTCSSLFDELALPWCLQDPEKVAQLGEEMLRLFTLHNSIACLALEGSKAPGKKGSKKGAAAAAAGGTAPDGGGEQQVGGQGRVKISLICVSPLHMQAGVQKQSHA